MIANSGDPHFLRLIEILQPVGGIMFIVEGYFDESGDFDTDQGIFCVAGYFIDSENAKLMDADWGRVLRSYNVPYFHMVDCAHGNGVFSSMRREDRIEIVKELIGLIKKYTSEGFAWLAKKDSFDPPMDKELDPYSYCASGCASSLQMFLKMNRIQANIAYFFEEGHKNRNSAYNHIAQKVKGEKDSLTFAAKEQLRLLQAADLLAWQCTKYAKDYFFAVATGEEPKRPPRKDFMSLMEHDHSFMYSGPGGQMGIELWPLSKRSQFTTKIELGDEGPFTYFREEGDDIPILPVEASIGCRMGGARFAYVAFNGFKDHKFALAFDEPRLFEALGALVHATGIFEQSEIMPIISSETLKIEDFNGKKILRIKIQGGACIGLALPEDVVERLKVILNEI